MKTFVLQKEYLLRPSLYSLALQDRFSNFAMVIQCISIQFNADLHKLTHPLQMNYYRFAQSFLNCKKLPHLMR